MAYLTNHWPTISSALPDARLRAISLGAGVQSTVMALMAADGLIGPMPDLAIFADTVAEPKGVYDHLAWLETQLPFPVHRVSKGNLGADTGSQREKGRFAKMDLPAYVGTAERPGGQVNRSCTRDYKIRPIQALIRERLGLTGKRAPGHAIVEQWIGISMDEIVRMKPSREAFIRNRWPLIECDMDRQACLRWFRARFPGRPLVKSACVWCPFHGPHEWQAVREDPEQWAVAVEMDERLRDPALRFRNKGRLYLHRSCRPLAEIDDFLALDDGAQGDLLGECEGMCGV